MIKIYVNHDEICMGKYFSGSDHKPSILCGNCNLSFRIEHLFKTSNEKRRAINCPHCGKWNKLTQLYQFDGDIHEFFDDKVIIISTHI